MPVDDEGPEGSGGFRRGCGAWLARWWRALAAEALGTALLVALGVASLVQLPGREAPPLAHPAMAFGFVVVACVAVFGPVSGAHLNPAVTLAALVAGRLRAAPAAAYAAAQVVGAVLGFAALQGALPLATGVGVTRPARGVPAPAAAAVEAALTALLALTCCAAWETHDAARPDPALPIKIGLVVAGLVYAGGAASGASINPARSFAPALLHNDWDSHWVYWVGPLGGAMLAALLHRFVLARPRAPPAASRPAELLPLTDKP